MEQKMFSVSIDKEFDVATKETKSSVYLRLYTSLFQSGIVKELKPTSFTVLLAVASFMDAEGNCYPTQKQISDITGISSPTVNKAINKLLDYKVNGQPILRREMVQKGQFKNSYYTVNPVSQLAIFDGQIKEIYTEQDKETLSDPIKKFNTNNNQETITNKQYSDEPDTTFKTSRDVVQYFISKYKDQYGVNPSVNWGRDSSLVKSKIMANYSNDQIKTIFDIAVEQYDQRWKNNRYKRPTIPAVASFIADQALAIAEDGQKEYQELEELTSNSDEQNDEVLNKFNL
ncbi:helix-turn-helix domain-containing protein [Halobacillus karajensis]|uniref:helix-turn-helix domain-containing protein n=1 Tax=Halobacillus karajensis TaxID=195088 RepID=UPI00045D3F43|nr:helix-turn-helix domain-containing protein [Halobacillus karajensis]CDQ21717.1 hypothetical protein BN982_04126 [Halobacillus karajensis]